MEETIKKDKSLLELIQDRIQQLELQKRQIEMSYAEIMGSLNEAKNILNIVSAENQYNQ